MIGNNYSYYNNPSLDYLRKSRSVQSSPSASRLSFSSQPLYDTKIKKINPDGSKEIINAKITKYSNINSEDKRAMSHIAEKWYSEGVNENMFAIKYRFFHIENDNKFLAVELDDDSLPLEERTIGIAEIIDLKGIHSHLGFNDIEILYLQTAPGVQSRQYEGFLDKGPNPDRQYANVGEALVYGVCKDSKRKGFNAVILSSSNDEFYKRIGMKKNTGLSNLYSANYYGFVGNDVDEFIRRFEEKNGM